MKDACWVMGSVVQLLTRKLPGAKYSMSQDTDQQIDRDSAAKDVARNDLRPENRADHDPQNIAEEDELDDDLDRCPRVVGHNTSEDENQEDNRPGEHVPRVVVGPLPEHEHRGPDHEKAEGREGRHSVKSGEPFSKQGSAGSKHKHQKQCQKEHAKRVPAHGHPKSFFRHPANLPPIRGD